MAKEPKAPKAGKEGKKGKGSKSTFDFMTVLGLVMGIVLILFGITFVAAPKPTDANYDTAIVAYNETGPINFAAMEGFINYPSLAITVGGTIAALMIAFPVSTFAKIPSQLRIALLPTKYAPQEYIEQIVEFAKEARMKGLLSLEDKLRNTKDPFLSSSLMLVVDSVEPEKVHNLLESELDHLDERHAQARVFYEKGAAFAPGFGMIGTLIGLVNMLGNMEDAATIGPAMATALLTTLYGSMLGNLLFGPIANKLRVRHEEEYLCKALICVGVESIQAGENPKFIEEKLQMLVVKDKPAKAKKPKKGEKKDEAADK